MEKFVFICMIIIIIGNVYSLLMHYVRKKIRPQIMGKIGETLQSFRLETLNKNEYVVLNNILIKDKTNHTHQIDHVVFSKYGIFVIETKNYSGKIYDRNGGKTWVQYVNGTQNNFHSPVYQNYGHLVSLSELLNLPKEKFISLIAFTTTADINSVKNRNVVYSTELLKVIKSYKNIIIEENIYKFIDIVIKNNLTGKENLKQHINTINEEIISNKIKTNKLDLRKAEPKGEIMDLYFKIKAWRNEKAKSKGIPAYAIFDNETLKALSTANIQNKEDLLKIYGIGNAKYNLYGDELYNLIRYSNSFVDDKKTIKYNDKIVVVDEEGNEETYIIVPSYYEGKPVSSSIYYPKSEIVRKSDADISKNEISDQSLVGKTLLGKKVGETVTIRLENGSYNLYIKEIL